LRKLIEAEAHRQSLPLAVAVEADDLQLLKDLVVKSLGSTVLPLSAVHGTVTAGQLCAYPIIDPHLLRKLVLAEPLGRQPSNAVRRFSAMLRDEVTEMVSAGIWEGQLLGSDRKPA
jgi:LysR family transcriptional regulator, nitrogen assimilation regulatory protein